MMEAATWLKRSRAEVRRSQVHRRRSTSCKPATWCGVSGWEPERHPTECLL